MASLDLERWLDIVLGEETVEQPGLDVEEVTVPAADGLPLAGTLSRPRGTLHAAALLASGTGIPRQFYRRFAGHLARGGIATLTFDYRGIGGSAPATLRGFEASMQDWGRQDMAGAFDWLGDRFRGLPRHVVGHSVGGQLVGLMPHAGEVASVVSVGSSFGYWRAMSAPYRYFVGAMWYGVVPLTTRLLGYVPARRLGLGEDLPAGVAREWSSWGRRPDYFTADLAEGSHFADVRAPWLAVLATDDRIATGPLAAPLHRLYVNADTRFEWLVPEQHGLDRIGHLGFFARSSEALWPRVSGFLHQTRPTRTPRRSSRAA